MDVTKDIKDFLMTRRARITPEQVGLEPGRRRRVLGLRREEVAHLAGVSIEYYTQIERGHVAGVSDDVLQSIARALQLDEAEETHLFDLVRATTSRGDRSRSQRRWGRAIPDGVQTLLDSMVSAPAVVLNGHLDIVAANALGRELYAPVFGRAHVVPNAMPNLARFIFFDPAADHLFPEWTSQADDAVSLLRAEAARSPTRRPSPGWWANSPAAASNSALGGRPTTSKRIGTVSSGFGIPRSANCRSLTTSSASLVWADCR